MNISLENIDNAPFSYKDVKKIVFFDNSWYILADNKLWQTKDAKNWKDLNLRVESAVFSISNDALIIASSERFENKFYIKRKGDPDFMPITLNINQGVKIAGAMYFKDRVYFFINFSVEKVHEKEGLIFNSKETYYADELTIYSSSLYGGDLKEEEKWWSSAESETITIINNRPILISKAKFFDSDGNSGYDYFFQYLTKENGWKRSDTGIKSGYSSEHKIMLVNNGVYYFKGSNFGGGNLLYFSDDGKYWDLIGQFNSYGENEIETATIGLHRETCLFSLGCEDEICYFSKNDSRRYPYKLCYGNSKVKPENYQSVEIKVLPNCLAFNEQGVGLLSTNTEDEEGIYLLKITR